MYDVVIIGAGPAGITAGIYAKRAMLNTMLVEKLGFGGQAVLTDAIENYPGFSKITGPGLIQKFEEHVAGLGLEITYAEIEKIDFLGQFATLVVMVPLKVALKDVFRSAIIECNQYGDFMKSNFIITNVKELNLAEIKDFLIKQQQANPPDVE